MRRNPTEIDINQLLWEGHAPECFYCHKSLGRKIATIDHLIPIVRGGPDVIENAVICCHSCNSKKKDKTLDEYIVYNTFIDWFKKKPDWSELPDHEWETESHWFKLEIVLEDDELLSTEIFFWHDYEGVGYRYYPQEFLKMDRAFAKKHSGVHVGIKIDGNKQYFTFTSGLLFEYYAIRPMYQAK